VTSEKTGTTSTYRLNISVLEQALLGFSNTLGLGLARSGKAVQRKKHV
jgi:hypothetical protein